MSPSPSFDHVIVGAGSAGCVLAERLSADPSHRVLLLEAGGPDDDPAIAVPAAFFTLQGGANDWGYRTERPGALTRTLTVPRGRVLGGSSSINGMIYMRGHRADYDQWRDEHGAIGWGYDDLLPAFVRSEANVRLGAPFHGTDGPLHVEDPVELLEVTSAWVESAVAGGLPRTDDFNGAQQIGAGPLQLTCHQGRRWSAADAYLRPALDRPNLTVVTGAAVERVLIDHGRAWGVRYRDGSPEPRVAVAEREVVLAAGAIGSPQLLLLSGIGPADDLQALGVEVLADLPGVGANLHDHPFLPVMWATKDTSDLALLVQDPRAAQQWAEHGTGPLASNSGDTNGFFSTAGGDVPDMQVLACGTACAEGYDPQGVPAFTAILTMVETAGRGRVVLRDADPRTAPLIDLGIYADPRDLERMREGYRRLLDLCAGPDLTRLLDRPLLDRPVGPDGSEFDAWARRWTQTLWHPVGTCAMGTGPGAVVDPSLRVHAVEGLRVVDASVMPSAPRGNTNAPTIAIAERAAALITTGTGALAHSAS